MREQRIKLSRSSAVIKPIDYLLKRWGDFTRFTEDGRICLTNNAAERALRGLALGRKAWLFAGSDRGAERAAVMITLIMTARLNDVDPQAWLADVFARIAAIPQNRLHELLPGSGSGSTERLQPLWPPEPEPIVAVRHLARTRQSPGLPRLGGPFGLAAGISGGCL